MTKKTKKKKVENIDVTHNADCANFEFKWAAPATTDDLAQLADRVAALEQVVDRLNAPKDTKLRKGDRVKLITGIHDDGYPAYVSKTALGRVQVQCGLELRFFQWYPRWAVVKVTK